MNNGRYLSLMDLGRLDYMHQVGLLWPCASRRWLPVLGATQMTYRRPINLWQRFSIESELEYWDDKWLVMKQTFVMGGAIVASGRIRGLFLGPQGKIRPAQILEAAKIQAQSPPASADLKLWFDSLACSADA